MGFTYKVNFDPKGLRLKAQLDKGALTEALLVAERQIIERTQAAKGVDGTGLPKLKEPYRSWKREKTGRDAPDRTLSGTLLKAIHSKVTGGGLKLTGIIYFLDSGYARSKARVHQVARAMQNLKPFFGLNKQQVEAIKDAIRKGLGQ